MPFTPVRNALVSAGCLALLSTAAPACGSTPVSAGPLKGTVYGAPFEAKSAHLRLRSSPSPVDSVIVYSRDVPCGSEDTTAASVVVNLQWQAGFVEEDLGDSKTSAVSFRRFKNGGSIEGIAATEGRIEVVTAGTGGTLRIRAAEETGNSVEGEVAVRLCE